jgi:hypothetical protein
MNKRHLGFDLDDFLAKEGLLAECEATALKCVVTWQLEQIAANMPGYRYSQNRLAALESE